MTATPPELMLIIDQNPLRLPTVRDLSPNSPGYRLRSVDNLMTAMRTLIDHELESAEELNLFPLNPLTREHPHPFIGEMATAVGRAAARPQPTSQPRYQWRCANGHVIRRRESTPLADFYYDGINFTAYCRYCGEMTPNEHTNGGSPIVHIEPITGTAEESEDDE